MELLEQCRLTSEEMTQVLLTYELSNWSDQTCLSLAVSASHRAFIANTSCQILLTEMWMGALRTRRYANLKVSLSRVSGWVGSVLGATDLHGSVPLYLHLATSEM